MAKSNVIAKNRRFYEEYVAELIHEKFGGYENRIAVGIAGEGSDCFGYDDGISQDHDFEPGFCILLPGEDVVDRKTAFQLERAYAKLPKNFGGFPRSVMQPVGGARHGVLRTADVFMDKTGTPDGCLTQSQWLSIPENSLAEAVNGEIFLTATEK